MTLFTPVKLEKILVLIISELSDIHEVSTAKNDFQLEFENR